MGLSAPTSLAPPTTISAGERPTRGAAPPTEPPRPPRGEGSEGRPTRRGGKEPATPTALFRGKTKITREEVEFGWRSVVETGTGDSVLHDQKVARALLRMSIHPRDVDELSTQSVNEVIDGSFPNVVRLVHDIDTMRTIIWKYTASARSQEARIKAASDRTEKSERERDEATRREAEATESAASRMKEKDEALAKARDALQRSAADLKFSESERARAASQSLINEERARAAERKLKAAEARVAELEAEVGAANKRAEKAVEDYQASSAFEADVANASVDAYHLGFSDCREQFGEAFPGLDIGRVQPIGEAEAEGAGGEGEAAGTEVVPADEPAATSAGDTAEGQAPLM